MTAISRNKVKIWIESTGTAASALVETAAIAGEIKSYSKSGGERDVETDPVFGGFVDKEKPISQVELAFEIVPDISTTAKADRWDSFAYSADSATGVYTMAGDITDKAVFIAASDGTTGKAWGFNNCSVIVYDIEHNADDNQTSNMTMKFSPTNTAGVSNFMTVGTSGATPLAVVNKLPAWTALDNN